MSTVQHEAEQKKLDEYRSRIAMPDAEEAKLAIGTIIKRKKKGENEV